MTIHYGIITLNETLCHNLIGGKQIIKHFPRFAKTIYANNHYFVGHVDLNIT